MHNFAKDAAAAAKKPTPVKKRRWGRGLKGGGGAG